MASAAYSGNAVRSERGQCTSGLLLNGKQAIKANKKVNAKYSAAYPVGLL